MSNFTRGKVALGICDRSGFEYPLKDLVPEYVDGKATGMLIGRDYIDPDHPQLKLGEVDASDRQSLRDPRPEMNLAAERSILWSWNPVGLGLVMVGSVGTVTVSTN